MFILDLHFDAEHIEEGQQLLGERDRLINSVIGDNNFAVARNQLGQSLHSIQVNKGYLLMGH